MRNPLTFDWKEFFSTLPAFEQLLSQEAVIMFLGWMAFQVILERLLPGETVDGAVLPNTKGSRLKYTMSGHLQFWVTIMVMGHIIPHFTAAEPYLLKGLSPLKLELIYDHYVQLITISVFFSAGLSAYLYAASFIPGKQLAKGGNTGNHIYDFFIGRELV